jgi:hypothetical protein
MLTSVAVRQRGGPCVRTVEWMRISRATRDSCHRPATEAARGSAIRRASSLSSFTSPTTGTLMIADRPGQRRGQLSRRRIVARQDARDRPIVERDRDLARQRLRERLQRDQANDAGDDP